MWSKTYLLMSSAACFNSISASLPARSCSGDIEYCRFQIRDSDDDGELTTNIAPTAATAISAPQPSFNSNWGSASQVTGSAQVSAPSAQSIENSIQYSITASASTNPITQTAPYANSSSSPSPTATSSLIQSSASPTSWSMIVSFPASLTMSIETSTTLPSSTSISDTSVTTSTYSSPTSALATSTSQTSSNAYSTTTSSGSTASTPSSSQIQTTPTTTLHTVTNSQTSALASTPIPSSSLVTASALASSSSTSNSSSTSLSSGSIAGIAIGCTAATVLILTGLAYLFRRCHYNRLSLNNGTYPRLAYLYDPPGGPGSANSLGLHPDLPTGPNDGPNASSPMLGYDRTRSPPLAAAPISDPIEWPPRNTSLLPPVAYTTPRIPTLALTPDSNIIPPRTPPIPRKNSLRMSRRIRSPGRVRSQRARISLASSNHSGSSGPRETCPFIGYPHSRTSSPTLGPFAEIGDADADAEAEGEGYGVGDGLGSGQNERAGLAGPFTRPLTPDMEIRDMGIRKTGDGSSWWI